MTPKDPHLTTEQLSAYLDDALSVQDRAVAEEHLQTCAHCQQALTGLRQTVALLHALPQPTLPRSFVLSQDMVAERTAGAQLEYGEHILPFPATPRRTKRGYLYNTVRFMSLIAALIGIFLLGASLFSALPHAASTMSNASSTASGGAISPLSPTKEAGKANAGTASTPGLDHTLTPHVTKPETIVPKPAQPTPSLQQSLLAFFDLTRQQGRVTTGVLLLALGIIGLLALRWQRQKMQL